jgi:hypothetical protein
MSDDMLDSYSRIDAGPIGDSMLEELLALAKSATPRPWFVRDVDDTHASSLVAISTKEGTCNNEHWPNFDPSEIVAATLVQNPRYVSIADEKWDENARYIVAAVTVLPFLIEEVIRLRRRVEHSGDGLVAEY